LDTVLKNWASLRKLIAPCGVPNWLRAYLQREAMEDLPNVSGKRDLRRL